MHYQNYALGRVHPRTDETEEFDASYANRGVSEVSIILGTWSGSPTDQEPQRKASASMDFGVLACAVCVSISRSNGAESFQPY